MSGNMSSTSLSNGSLDSIGGSEGITHRVYASETADLYRVFGYDHEISKLANYEKLCKLTDQIYVICPEHCCGEFWESQPQFCCKNNFKPIRNLFFSLLIGFLVLFATIVTYLFTETISSVFITRKLKELQEGDPTALAHDIKAIVRDFLSSDETSIDEENSIDNEILHRSVLRPRRHWLVKHSQSFKDMSKKRRHIGRGRSTSQRVNDSPVREYLSD